MPHVITRPCCNDATCVTVCPVNCIHPTPAEPNFLTAEMLYIDPDTCIDCGACVDECPVEAIIPDDQLDESAEKYLQINADYFTDHEVDTGVVPPRKRQAVPADQQLRVAIVGAGPAAFYAAEELLKVRAISVDVFDRLPTPYGLVRAGVAPDHALTKGVEKTFAGVAAKPKFTYHLGVEIGTHLTPAELAQRYGAVLYAHGASADKQLGIPGDDLPGSVSATEFVAWYNGHPDYADWQPDLSGSTAVVIGNGNVALDVARILVSDPNVLAKTDIADHALNALRESNIREVHVIARRGPAQAAFTNQEFLALTDIDGVDVIVEGAEVVLDELTAAAEADGSLDSTIATKLRLIREAVEAGESGAERRVIFRFLESPTELTGDGRVEAITLAKNELEVADDRVAVRTTDETHTIDTSLVLRSIGYTGVALDGVPFDAVKGVIPNADNRIEGVAGGYVCGWIGRGASGGIGMNRADGLSAADRIVEDFAAGVLTEPEREADDVVELATSRGATVIDKNGWKAIDKAEVAAGKAARRRRVKFVSIAELNAAATADV